VHDELVFMVRDAGTRAPASTATPSGCIAGSRVELALTDPLNGSNLGFAYLFRSDGSIAQGAGVSYVNYSFTFGNGLSAANYKASYDYCTGGVAENTTVTTANYSMHYSGRWIEDELRITAGGATGVDILDRHQAFVYPTNCFRSEDTFSGSRGPIVTTKPGPVRAIRSIMGANSGVFTQMTMKYTLARVDHRVDFRVHPIGGYYDVLDFNQNAVGMTYYNNQNPAGVVVNGVQDPIVTTAPNLWELHTGPQGSIAGSYAFLTNIQLGPEGFVEAYYDDSIVALCRCTGDLSAYGSSGFHLATGICTDRWATSTGCGAAAKDFAGLRYTYLLPPGVTPADAAAYRNQALNPVAVSIPPAPCEGDLTGDGIVNGADLTVLLGAWGQSGGAPDINADGVVNGADLTVLLARFNTGC
ncbi:MAG: GC-type dockerin domain-anchored protein, partial [Planctomycetota bacterium]